MITLADSIDCPLFRWCRRDVRTWGRHIDATAWRWLPGDPVYVPGSAAGPSAGTRPPDRGFQAVQRRLRAVWSRSWYVDRRRGERMTDTRLTGQPPILTIHQGTGYLADRVRR